MNKYVGLRPVDLIFVSVHVLRTKPLCRLSLST